jgi:hypothetical protein
MTTALDVALGIYRHVVRHHYPHQIPTAHHSSFWSILLTKLGQLSGNLKSGSLAMPSEILSCRAVCVRRPHAIRGTLQVSDYFARNCGLLQNSQVIGNADVAKLEQRVMHPAEAQDIG